MSNDKNNHDDIVFVSPSEADFFVDDVYHEVLNKDFDTEKLSNARSGSHVYSVAGANTSASDLKALVSDENIDDEYLLNEDELVASASNMAIIRQLDLQNTVHWEMNNLYKEDGKVRNRLSLYREPPVFTLEDAHGSFTEFVVTKELATTLHKIFEDTDRAYAGIPPKKEKDENIPKIFTTEYFAYEANKAKQWIMDNKMMTILMVLIVLLFVYAGIVEH